MKHIRMLLIGLTLAAPLALASSADAATLSVSREIRVTAIVAPKRTVIVDETNRIIEIASNTEEDVKPTIYLSKPSKENERELTDELYKQYRRLIPEGTAKVGILYRPVQTVLKQETRSNSPINTSIIGSLLARPPRLF
ncbi:MAG TPA: hypothetical protein VK983_01990 [Candidatus Limnocylindrales bacterium]|nr:hypothetical protein [Candidatus Limnocylindrales bacterium]